MNIREFQSIILRVRNTGKFVATDSYAAWRNGLREIAMAHEVSPEIAEDISSEVCVEGMAKAGVPLDELWALFYFAFTDQVDMVLAERRRKGTTGDGGAL